MKGKSPPGSKWRQFASIPPYVVGPNPLVAHFSTYISTMKSMKIVLIVGTLCLNANRFVATCQTRCPDLCLSAVLRIRKNESTVDKFR